MIKVIGIKGNSRFERKFDEYWRALTAAVQLQSMGFIVQIIK